VLRYRARPGEKAKHTHGSHTLEMVWTFIPGVILFGLAIFQTSTWKEIKFKQSLPDSKEAFHVQVLGKQFEWLFRYPGADGKFGTDDDIYSNAELHVPVNRKVIVHLQTLDVLHSFWLPNVRLKQDLLPGRTIPQWFECVKTGTFTIVCAELCGSGHTKMGGHLIVDTPEKTEEWLRTREPGADSQSMKSWKEWKVRAAR
jgi:cytochrome c oxidase subunit 2